MATKQQIADVFSKHVERFGYAKTTLDEVARELRISKKTLYVHFDGKQDIYRHVVAGRAAQEQAQMRQVLSGTPTYTAKLEMLMRYVVGAARAHIHETTADEWLQEYEVAADAFRQAHGDLMRELVAEGMAAGEFRQGDARLVEKMVAAMIVEYLLMVNVDPTYDRDDELMERTLRFIG